MAGGAVEKGHRMTVLAEPWFAAVCDVLRWVNGIGSAVLILILLSRHRAWAALPVWLRFYANGLMAMLIAVCYGAWEALGTHVGPAVRVPLTTVALAWVTVGIVFPRHREPYTRRRARQRNREDPGSR